MRRTMALGSFWKDALGNFIVNGAGDRKVRVLLTSEDLFPS